MSRKAEILGQLLDEEWHTAPEVAAALGIGLSNASELLRRYHVQGLVRRRVRRRCFPRGPYAYQITEKGVERYEWLTGPGKQAEVTRPGPGPLRTPARRPPDFYHGPPAAYSPYPQYAKPGWRGPQGRASPAPRSRKAGRRGSTGSRPNWKSSRLTSASSWRAKRGRKGP